MEQLEKCLAGKTAMVTGATHGIGKECAKVLAKAGAEVVLVGRNKALTQATVAELKQDTGNGKLSYLIADLSSQASIRRAAVDFLNTGRPLHILLNNAGAIFPEFRESMDGIEMTFALNHLGYFLMTKLLLPRLLESAPARIVNMASAAHFTATGINFNDPELRRNYSAYAAYSQSKLANVLFTRELALRLEGTGVTANCLHPGFVDSNFGKDSNGNRYLASSSNALRISVQAGAQTAIYLCTAPEVEKISGGYFYQCRLDQPSAYARDDYTARHLWEISEAMVSQIAKSLHHYPAA